MKFVVIDSNIILRFLLTDNIDLSKEAKKIIKTHNLYIDEVVLAEVVWVLSSFYQKDREWVVQNLKKFISLPTVFNPNKGLMLEALETYLKNTFSYIDCWIYVKSQELAIELKTQDKKLAKLAQIK